LKPYRHKEVAVSDLPFHEVASLFPLMSGDEYESLKADIRANGLREHVWTYGGKVVDGRNRCRACEELGVDVITREWDGKGSLVAFVVSLNLHRRHLNQSQKAMIAAEMLPMLEKEAKERQRAAGERGDEGGRGKKKETLEANSPQGFREPRPRAPQSRDIAAKLVGVGARSVQDAKQLKQRSPELAARVSAGQINLRPAVDQTRGKPAASHQSASVNPTASFGDHRKTTQRAVRPAHIQALIDKVEELHTLVDKPALQVSIRNVKMVVDELREMVSRFK
jgi:hypothetical protein